MSAAVKLRAIERGDLATLRDWRNALHGVGTVRQWFPLSMADQERWFETVVLPRDRHVMLAVTDAAAEKPRPIGVVGLTYCDWVRRKAEASIYIGPEELRGQGFGEAALRSLCDFGFGRLGLRCLYAEILTTNEPSIRLFKTVGFVEEGLLRSRYFVDGQWIDSWMMSMLDDEWRRARP